MAAGTIIHEIKQSGADLEVVNVTKDSIEMEEAHKNLSKEGYFLPNTKTQLFNTEFIDAVNSGKVWLPKTAEMNFQQAVLPPGRRDLTQQIVKLLKQSGEMFEGEEG